MSNKFVNAAWASTVDDRTELLVLVDLADRANAETSCCWPSLEQIGDRCRCSRRTAQRSIRALEAAGHITVKNKRGGRNKACEYFVHPKARVEGTIEEDREKVFGWEKGAKSSTKGVTRDAKGAKSSKIKGAKSSIKGVTGDAKGAKLSKNRVTGDTPTQRNPKEPKYAGAVPAHVGGIDDLRFLALAKAQGSRASEMTGRERGQVELALREILEAAPEVTAAEIGARAREYRVRVFPKSRLTAMALAKHWSTCAPEPVEPVEEGEMNGAEAPVEPEQWREAWAEMYGPNCQIPGSWREVPVAYIGGLLAQITEMVNLRKKNERGAGV